jgi:hypothetical protein
MESMTEKQRTYQSDVHSLQNMSLQSRPAKEKVAAELVDHPLAAQTVSSPPVAVFSREVLLRLINRLKGS